MDRATLIHAADGPEEPGEYVATSRANTNCGTASPRHVGLESTLKRSFNNMQVSG
jgi:hypothetical protein